MLPPGKVKPGPEQARRWPWFLLAGLALAFVVVNLTLSNLGRDDYEELLIFPTGPGNRPVPGKLSVCWTGVGGLWISDGKNTLAIDPFVSRHGLLPVGLGAKINSWPDEIRLTIQSLGIDKLKNHGVLISHSHYDHSLDGPGFARQTDAPLWGSPSTLRIGRAAGLPEIQLKAVPLEKPLRMGPFTVRFFASHHGPALFGKIPYPGKIEDGFELPARASDLKLGRVYTIVVEHPRGSLLHHASAGWKDISPRTGKQNLLPKVDFVFLGVAGRAGTKEYLDKVVRPVKPSWLIPIHMDNFFRPVSPHAPLSFDFIYTVNFAEFVESARAQNYQLSTLPLFRWVLLPGTSG